MGESRLRISLTIAEAEALVLYSHPARKVRGRNKKMLAALLEARSKLIFPLMAVHQREGRRALSEGERDGD